MKIDRLVSMVMVLLDKQRVSARELADRFEVSLRTVYRDMEAIGMAGIPVRSTPGTGGGFEIMPEYKLDKKVFSAQEISALLMGLSSLSGMIREEELAHALAKVRSFIPAGRAEEIACKVNQIRIDVSPWMGGGHIQPRLERIQAAMQESRLLTFAYIAHHGAETSRTVEPCQLVLKGSRWYLHGYCRGREDFRLFRVSRMWNLQMEEEIFAPRAHQRPQLDFEEMGAAMQTRITLRIHSSVMDRVLDFCRYEDFSPDGAEHYLVLFPFIENEYYYDILLGFGRRCECLVPPHVRRELKRRIQDMAAIYEGHGAE